MRPEKMAQKEWDVEDIFIIYVHQFFFITFIFSLLMYISTFIAYIACFYSKHDILWHKQKDISS